MIKRRIVGIDYGIARIGVAVSDELKIIATPLLVLKCEKKAEETAKKLIAELEKDQSEKKYEIEKIVIGMPYMMSGKIGFLADEVRNFTSLLQNLISVPIILWDERLTTVQAERSLREASLTRKRRSQMVDR